MFTSAYIFTPQKQTPRAKEKVQDAVWSLFGSLTKNGQVYGDPLMTWIGGKLQLTCHIPRPDSLAAQHHSEWGSQDYDKLCSLLADKPQYRVLDDGPFPKKYTEWRTAKSLYLFTTFLDISSPVCSGNNGDAIPLYTLPLTAQIKQQLVSWQKEYKAMDSLWISSGELEMKVYRQLADTKSGLAMDGRQLCAEIESATGKPTYYYLMRYWGRRDGEANRLCPNCGNSWNTQSANKRFFDFEFRCDSCRLVSSQGVSVDDERHARIGEYPRQSYSG